MCGYLRASVRQSRSKARPLWAKLETWWEQLGGRETFVNYTKVGVREAPGWEKPWSEARAPKERGGYPHSVAAEPPTALA